MEMPIDTSVPRSSLVAVRGGRSYRIESPDSHALVTPILAAELEQVLERFAREARFSEHHSVSVVFKPGIVGHHTVGRAADIYEVGGQGFDKWKHRWDTVQQRAQEISMPEEHFAMLARERACNLGWRLYKALQRYGRWSQPYGFPIQLFGPWTRSEGPWTFISDRLLHAHRDHVHVAK
jgi:hypothetical protein